MSDWIVLTAREGPTVVRATEVISFVPATLTPHITMPRGSSVCIRGYPKPVYVDETVAEISRLIGL